MRVRIATVECDGYWAASVRHPYSVWPGCLTVRGTTEAEAVRGLHDIWRYYVRRV